MLSKISCSATKLSLLQPAMIRAIAESSAFRVGKQYATEKRVRIARADDVEIVSHVMGNAGQLEQTIQLKEGSLHSQCTCQLNERPLCRHCIAVLLEYHRAGAAGNAASARPASPPPPGAQPRARPARVEEEVADVLLDTEPPAAPPHEVKFSEIAVFIEWLQPAISAMQRGEPLPDGPMLGHGPVDEWVRTIHALEEGQRLNENSQQALRSEFEDVQGKLDLALRQASEARAATDAMQGELARRRTIDKKLAEVCSGVDRFGEQIKAVAHDLASSGARLEALNGSFKEISRALDSITKAAS